MLAAEHILMENFRKFVQKKAEEEAAAYRACWEKFRAFLEASDRLGELETTEEQKEE